jgi:CDP-glucose 4,6-dehydratase
MEFTLGQQLKNLPGPILITGHTGFKGTWLTFLLESLGISVVGLSLAPEQNSLFDRSKRQRKIPETFADIRDFNSVDRFLKTHKPSAIFHLAAQPLVLESYKTPRETFDTNVMGIVNILDASFKSNSVEAVVVATTDKVYRNDNSGRPFVESDALEGKDPYSASKVGTEAAVAAWQQIAKVSGGPKIVSARAGNVIGGGDWAQNRLIPDLIRGFASESPVQIRNPDSTRPWQHVLDPLHGYVMTMESVLGGESFHSINFGPDSNSLSVREVVDICKKSWFGKTTVEFVKDEQFGNIEATSLQLDSDFARKMLGWRTIWSQDASVISTMEWWDKVLNKSVNPEAACQNDIEFLLPHTSSLGIS